MIQLRSSYNEIKEYYQRDILPESLLGKHTESLQILEGPIFHSSLMSYYSSFKFMGNYYRTSSSQISYDFSLLL